MGTAAIYKKQIIDLTKELAEDKIQELIDFGQFLKTRQKNSSYSTISDSAAYVRGLRAKESKGRGSAKRYIQELIEWQKSDS